MLLLTASVFTELLELLLSGGGLLVSKLWPTEVGTPLGGLRWRKSSDVKSLENRWCAC